MRPIQRRLSIADIMILILASAASTLILQSYLPGHARQLGYFRRNATDPLGLWILWSWLHGPGSCLVVPLMAALILMRLRQPRPRWSRLISQPGFVACLAVMASILPGIAWIATIHHRPGFQRPGGFEQVWSIATHWADTTVLGSWMALALSRRWRPEPSWIDRSGRVLGLYWVLLLFLVYAIQWLQKIQQLLSQGGPA
jgi:hypothetical protein